MTAHRKREERRQKEKLEEFKNLAVALQIQALQIGQAFGGIDEAHPLRTVEDYYPKLFPNSEKEKCQKQLNERNARLRAAAAEHNARLREAKGGEP